MAAIIASAVVFVSLIAGGSFAYLSFQAYKKRRRIPVVDEERARNLEHTARNLQHDTVLQDVDRPEGPYTSGQWYGSPGIVPADVAPVAKPLPSSPVVEYTGGEGLVSPPKRVFRFEEAVKGKGKGKERVLEDDQFQEQTMNKNRAHDLQGFGSGYTSFNTQQQLEILSPNPIRAVTLKANATSKDTAYEEEQEKLSGYWDDIEKRKNINTGRKPKHKLQKQPTILAQDSVHGSTKIDATDWEDVDLNSGPAWAKDKRPATPPPRKTLKIRESFNSSTTLGVANNLNSERPLEHVLSKQNIEFEIAKPKAAVVDRAAEAKRRMEEAKRRKAEKERLEKEERQAEERRELEERRERGAEQQKRDEKEKQRIEEERARTLAQMTSTEEPKRRVWKDSSAQQPVEVKNYGKYAFDSSSDSGSEKSRRQSVRRGSNTSKDAKSREKPFTRSPQRSNTFTGAGTIDSSDANEKPNLNISTNSRSMSMTEPTKPNFNAKMPSIAETSYATNDNDMRTIHESSNPDRSAPHITQPSPVYSSGRDSKSSSNAQQRSSTGSTALYSSSSGSRQSSILASRNSNASTNDSPEEPHKPFTNANFPSRGSVDSRASKKSKHSSEGSSDPERKPSMRERAFSKLGRKGSDKSDKLDKAGRARMQQERNSAGSTQSWEHDGPQLRGGSGLMEEPEEMSEEEHAVLRLRGGEGSVEGSSAVESENSDEETSGKDADDHEDELSEIDLDDHHEDHASEVEVEEHEHEDDESEHEDEAVSGDEHSDTEHSEDEDSEADSEDDSEDDPEDEHSEAEQSEQEDSDDEVTGDEDSDPESEEAVLKTSVKDVRPLSVKASKAIAVGA